MRGRFRLWPALPATGMVPRWSCCSLGYGNALQRTSGFIVGVFSSAEGPEMELQAAGLVISNLVPIVPLLCPAPQ